MSGEFSNSITENKNSLPENKTFYDPDKRIEIKKMPDLGDSFPSIGPEVYNPDLRIGSEKSPIPEEVKEKHSGDESSWIEIFSKKFCDPSAIENSQNVENNATKTESNNENILTEIPGGGEPNSDYTIDGHKYKTDDNGNIYNVDGKNLPNCKYELNGYEYETDEKGRIIRAEGDLKIPEYEPRPKYLPDIDDRRGQDDERGSDDRGHLIAHEFGGADTEGNLVPMNSEVNQSGEYRQLEKELRKLKEEGHDVHVTVEPQYEDDSNRPISFIVTYTVDGETYEKVITNEAQGGN